MNGGRGTNMTSRNPSDPYAELKRLNPELGVAINDREEARRSEETVAAQAKILEVILEIRKESGYLAGMHPDDHKIEVLRDALREIPKGRAPRAEVDRLAAVLAGVIADAAPTTPNRQVDAVRSPPATGTAGHPTRRPPGYVLAGDPTIQKLEIREIRSSKKGFLQGKGSPAQSPENKPAARKRDKPSRRKNGRQETRRGKTRSEWLNLRRAKKKWTSDLDIQENGGPTYNTIRRYRSGAKSTRDPYVRQKLAEALDCEISDVPE
jgi:hypothetical protein